MSRLVLATIGFVCVVTTYLSVAAASNDVVTTWKTDNPGTSNSTTIGVAGAYTRGTVRSTFLEIGGGEEDLPPPPPPPSWSCNVNTVSDFTEYFDATYEACENLVVGPSFIAGNGATISLSSGSEIDFLPGFIVEQGATLEANVCGQSLCMISAFPMPFGCHSCVDQICAIDASCCDLAFDQACLDMVNSECGLVCEQGALRAASDLFCYKLR